jgi:hypothetical protein
MASRTVASLVLAVGCAGNDPAPPAQDQPTTGGAAGAATSTLLDEPLAELPSKLSGVGIYPRAPQLDLAPSALAYEPSYPLWSDGGEKHRAIVLPSGTEIDASDRDNYVFPTGTLIFKTFAYRTPASPQAVVPIETRLLRLTEDGWELAAYAWNDDAQDAELLDLRRAQIREVLGDDDALVPHSIPSRLDCRQCHESNRSMVLGINELQLAASGSLSRLAPHLAPRPREPYDALPEATPLTSAVLGYFVGNCVHCHNGSNGAASSFDLRPAVALNNVIDQPTASSATADGIRVVPGDPEQSVLFLAVRGSGESEVKDMPPLGVAQRDRASIDLLADWINSLASDTDR